MPRQLPRLSVWPGFRRSLRPAAANHTVCSEPRPNLYHLIPALSLIRQHIDARLSAGDSSVSRKWEAAIVGARRTGFAGDRVHIVGVGVLSRISFPSVGCIWTQVSHAACSHARRMGAVGEAWRLDFRALSSKTAGTVARDGCKQGLAVYSVRSCADNAKRTQRTQWTQWQDPIQSDPLCSSCPW